MAWKPGLDQTARAMKPTACFIFPFISNALLPALILKLYRAISGLPVYFLSSWAFILYVLEKRWQHGFSVNKLKQILRQYYFISLFISSVWEHLKRYHPAGTSQHHLKRHFFLIKIKICNLKFLFVGSSVTQWMLH